MPFTFDPEWYADVRAAIGLDVDDVALPDATLGTAVFKGATEGFINRSLTEAQITDPANATAVKLAAVFYMASLAAPTLRLATSQSEAGLSVSFASVNLAAVAADLRERAAASVADVLAVSAPQDTNPVIGAIFTKAKRRDVSRW